MKFATVTVITTVALGAVLALPQSKYFAHPIEMTTEAGRSSEKQYYRPGVSTEEQYYETEEFSHEQHYGPGPFSEEQYYGPGVSSEEHHYGPGVSSEEHHYGPGVSSEEHFYELEASSEEQFYGLEASSEEQSSEEHIYYIFYPDVALRPMCSIDALIKLIRCIIDIFLHYSNEESFIDSLRCAFGSHESNSGEQLSCIQYNIQRLRECLHFVH